MEKKKDFIMVPMFIDDDPRLKPWLEDSRANDREIIWAVERMIGRLAKLKDKPCSIGKLLEGLHRRQLPFPLLKEIVVASGLFEYEDGYVKYDWERFAQPRLHSTRKSWEDDGESEDEMSSQSRPKVVPKLSQSRPVRPRAI